MPQERISSDQSDIVTAELKNIRARAPGQGVGTEISHNRIVASTADNKIVALAAAKHVFAAAAIDAIVSQIAVDCIVARSAGYDVIILTAVSRTIVAHDVSAHHHTVQQLHESEEHYRYTVAQSEQVAWSADPSGAVVEASEHWCDVTGIASKEALGAGWLGALHPDDIDDTIRVWQHCLASRDPADLKYRLRGADGLYRWFRSRAAPYYNHQGLLVRWYGTLENVHDRYLAQEAVHDSEQRFRLAAEAAGIGVWDFDIQHKRRAWSDELKRMCGLPLNAKPSVAVALSCVLPEDLRLVLPLFAAARAGDSKYPFQAAFRICRADDGRTRWLRTTGWRTVTDEGRLSRVLITIRDITEERLVEERLQWTVLHDPLTRLPNRAHFNDLLAEAINETDPCGGRLALLLLDIDRLKETNDLVGHDAGDAVLRTFANRLRELVPAEMVCARLDGDEFAILLLDATERDVRDLTARLIPILREPFTTQGYSLDCQATIGASLYPRDGLIAADLLKAADVALHVGKESQRGNVSIFEAEMRAGLQRRMSMLRVARTVIADDLVFPVYQPKVSLTDGRIVGFEALLRWRHARLGVQTPASISAAFEDCELATALSERMLEQVVRDMEGWLNQGFSNFGRVAFNLSPAEFRCGNLVSRILHRLEDSQIASSQLELEITEAVFLGSGAEKVGAALRDFHHAGITIALDDFGTGYASLTHLKAFPVDVIKIDRSFVSNVNKSPGDAAIVNAVIGLGRDLGMDVVAEGVEKIDEADYLRDHGCPSAQGYLFGRAMTAESIPALIAPRILL